MNYILILLMLLFGCNNNKIYDVTGIILEIKNNDKLIIKHDEIPDFMVAMTMPFNVNDSNIVNNLIPGDSVKFELVVKENDAFAQNFIVISHKNLDNMVDDDDFWESDEYDPLEAGDYISDATFLTLDSTEISLSDWEGNYLFISYIFTRCPMPNMCPALIVKNQYLAENFNNNNIKFLLISFDYLYDTPSKLKNNYFGIQEKYPNMYFLSSFNSLKDLNLLSLETGVSFWGIEENDIGHSMRSVLISPEGKLLNTYDGTDWIPKDIKKNINNFLLMQ